MNNLVEGGRVMAALPEIFEQSGFEAMRESQAREEFIQACVQLGSRRWTAWDGRPIGEELALEVAKRACSLR